MLMAFLPWADPPGRDPWQVAARALRLGEVVDKQPVLVG